MRRDALLKRSLMHKPSKTKQTLISHHWKMTLLNKTSSKKRPWDESNASAQTVRELEQSKITLDKQARITVASAKESTGGE